MKRHGQGVIEYVVVLALIVGALILAARSLFRNSTDTAVQQTEGVALNVIDGFLQGDG